MTLVHRAASGVALMFALTLATPPDLAGAACGGVRTEYPPKEERRFAPALAIGDSVMLGAVPQTARSAPRCASSAGAGRSSW